MTPRQIELVKQSWEGLKPRAEVAAEMFYSRLFELDPDLRRLFSGDIASQARKLASMITLAVSGLDRLEILVPIVRELGRKHASYGVENRHYATVGSALLDTLAAGLAESFTREVKDAWGATYALLANTMQSAAAAPVARARPAVPASEWVFFKVGERP